MLICLPVACIYVDPLLPVCLLSKSLHNVFRGMVSVPNKILPSPGYLKICLLTKKKWKPRAAQHIKYDSS